MTISSPQPSVLHLVTLFRQISAGEIRIPAFQREFVWKEKQMIELLESVVEGFPIGSILLWRVDHKMLNIAPSETTSFPDTPEQFPTSYVLDGMQRLTTLYGVFHFGVSTNDKRFDVLFNLENGQFSHREASLGDVASTLPLAALFSPRQLLEHQARLATLPNGDTLIDKLLALQSAFQDYMVPVVTIRSTDVNRIVGIFERINSTGTSLAPVDFMRAITWAEDFDLNHYLDDAVGDLAEIGFALTPETIIKCVGLTLGLAPTTDGLLKLRSQRPAKLIDAFQEAKAGLRKVAGFVYERFLIRTSDYIPYEGQLLLLFKSVGMSEASPPEFDAIVRWFWAAGFNESLRGRPDHYVVRAVENWRALVKGQIRGLEPRLKLTEFDLFERRLVTGGALSATFTAMHAVHGARSLIDGAQIDPSIYMATLDPNWFAPVFSRDELRATLADAVSARIFGNVVLVSKAERSGGPIPRELILNAANRGNWELLASQFVDTDVVKALRENDVLFFLLRRTELMHQAARQLVGDQPGTNGDLL